MISLILHICRSFSLLSRCPMKLITYGNLCLRFITIWSIIALMSTLSKDERRILFNCIRHYGLYVDMMIHRTIDLYNDNVDELLEALFEMHRSNGVNVIRMIDKGVESLYEGVSTLVSSLYLQKVPISDFVKDYNIRVDSILQLVNSKRRLISSVDETYIINKVLSGSGGDDVTGFFSAVLDVSDMHDNVKENLTIRVINIDYTKKKRIML